MSIPFTVKEKINIEQMESVLGCFFVKQFIAILFKLNTKLHNFVS